MSSRARASGTGLVTGAEGQDGGSPGPGWTSRPRRPRPQVPGAERWAPDAASGCGSHRGPLQSGPRPPRAVTGPPAATTLTLRRLGSRARPPQPPGRLPRPQRRKQPPALLAALLSCSHLCARAPPPLPPPPPEGGLALPGRRASAGAGRSPGWTRPPGEELAAGGWRGAGGRLLAPSARVRAAEAWTLP